MRHPFGLLWLIIALIGGICGGCHKSSSRAPLALFLVSFPEDQRSNLYRDQALQFEFSVSVDPASIDADSIQVLELPGRIPIAGLYSVSGSVVTFRAVVDEGVPNPGNVPLNPYGFAAQTGYEVVIDDQGMKTVRGAFGEALIQRFDGGFSTTSGFTPRPNDPDPVFVPFDPAVYDTTNPPYSPANPKGTVEPADDVLSYTPVPGTIPINPITNRPDYRAQHPTNVLVQMSFDAVIDPASVQTQPGGNLGLEYEISPASWTPIAIAASFSPSGKTIILTAGTPLANATRINRYRVRLDQTQSPMTSRGGKPVVAAVDVWDNAQRAIVRRTVGENELTIFTRLQSGETGPRLFFMFPLEPFVGDATGSDNDIGFASGSITAGPVNSRTAEDTTACVLPGNACSSALREPLTQSRTSSVPNPNSKGPSKIQFAFNSYQHAANAPAYKRPDAEALVDMSWAPLSQTVIPATYPKLQIQLGTTGLNSTISTLPAGLFSPTYASNFDSRSGAVVRDGTNPYMLAASGSTRWQSWGFERPYLNYRTDRALVFTAWTETGGDTEQYAVWYSPSQTPSTRIFNSPGPVNPPNGLTGQWTFYHLRFDFRRIRSVAVTKFYRITAPNRPLPMMKSVLASTSMIPNTTVGVEYAGADFANYQPRTVGSATYLEGSGAPIRRSAFSRALTVVEGFEAVALRVTFTADPANASSLPALIGLALGYEVP